MAYMVFVEGGGAPKMQHPTLEAAEVEARRLAGSNVGRVAHVVRIEASFIGEVQVKQVGCRLI